MFQYRLPTELRKKEEPPQEKREEGKEKEKEERKKEMSNQEETKSVPASTFTHVNATNSEQKEEDNSGTFNEYDEKKIREQEQKNKKRELTEKELDTKVYITLNETPTNFMFFSPSMRYFRDKHDAEEKEEKKKEEVFKSYKDKRKNKESFTNRGSQTLNKFKRNQIVSTSSALDQESNTQVDEKVNALCWNITDSINENKNKKEDEGKIFQKNLERKIKKELKDRMKTSESMTNPHESYSLHRSQMSENTYSVMDTRLSHSLHSSRRPQPKNSTTMIKESEDKSMMERSKQGGSSPNSSMVKNDHSSIAGVNPSKPQHIPIKESKKDLNMQLPNSVINPLRYVERLLSQNQFHFRQIAYKNYPISVEEFTAKKEIKNDALKGFDLGSAGNDDEKQNLQEQMFQKEIELVENKDEDPNMKFLFRFSGQRILNDNSKYIVHSLDWNPYNKDLLAAGYGDPDIDSKKEGLLCFWTLKNPLHPERVIRTPRGITSCNFSNKNPYYIVASDYAGEIMIYDLRVAGNSPIADSTELKDKHTDIVWETKWIERPNDKNEMIVSISSDGKVKEWSLKKGLEVTDLMRMKKNLSFPDKTLSPFAKYEKQKEGSKESLVFRDANGLSFDFPKNDTTIYYISLEECTLHRCRISYKDQYTDTYYGHQGPVYKVRCNPYDPNVLLSCSYDWTVKIWNSKQIYPLMTCHSMKMSHQVNDIEWSPFTSTIFGSVCDDGRIEIWDLAHQTIDPIIMWKTEEPSKMNVPRKSIKFSKSSQVVASGDSDFDIDVFRLYNLKHVEVRKFFNLKQNNFFYI